MNDRNRKEAWNQKRTYLKHLGNVETWLITVSKNPANIMEFVKDTEKISESCSHLVENFYTEVETGMGPDKQVMIVVGILNALIRVYAVDKSSIITSQEYFQAMNDIFVKFLEQFYEYDDNENSADNSDDDEEKNADNSDSSPTKHSQSALKPHIANIFDSLLTNFAQNGRLKKCLELYFTNNETSKIGTIIYDIFLDVPPAFVIVAQRTGENENTSYSAMLNTTESIPPPELIPSIPESLSAIILTLSIKKNMFKSITD